MEAPNNRVVCLVDDIDIFRTAKAFLIDQHGEAAAINAAMRADKLLEAGDTDGCAVWRRVIRVIEELQQRSPSGTTL